jgi:hypothetical protein
MSLAAREQTKEHLWKPGVSGNPNGLKAVRIKVDALFNELAGEIEQSGALSVVERVMLENACSLIVKAQRTTKVGDSVRASSEARRVIEGLRERRKSAPAAPSSPSYAELAARAAREHEAIRAAELAADPPDEMAGQTASRTPGEEDGA